MTQNTLRTIIVITFILSIIFGNSTEVPSQNYPTQNSNQPDNSVATRVISGSQVRQPQTQQAQPQANPNTNIAPVRWLQSVFAPSQNGKNAQQTNNEQMPNFPQTPGMNYVKVVNERGETIYVPEQFAQDFQQQSVPQANNNQNSIYTKSTNTVVMQSGSVPQTVPQTDPQNQKKHSLFSISSPFAQKSTPAPAVGNQTYEQIDTNNVTVSKAVPEQQPVTKKKFSLKTLFVPANKKSQTNPSSTVTTVPTGVPTPADSLPTPAKPTPTPADMQIVPQAKTFAQSMASNNESTQANSTQNNIIENPFAKPQVANSVYMQPSLSENESNDNNTDKDSDKADIVPSEPKDISGPEIPDMKLSEDSVPSQSTLEPIPEPLSETVVPEQEKLIPEEVPHPDEQEVKPLLPKNVPIPTQDVPSGTVTPAQVLHNPVRQESNTATPSTDTSDTQKSGQLVFPLEPVELDSAIPDVSPQPEQKLSEPQSESQLPEPQLSEPQSESQLPEPQLSEPQSESQLPEPQLSEPQSESQLPEPQLSDITPESIESQTTQIPVVELPETESKPAEPAMVDSSDSPLQLEIQGPKEVEYGRNEKFTLVISNNSSFPMTNLTLRVHPQGFGEDKTATVKILELVPGQPRRISMKLNARQKNELSLMANIGNETGIIVQKEIAITVKNEKIKLSILPPTYIPNIGDKAPYTIQISNQSEQPVQFNFVVFFSEGLEPAEIQGIKNAIQSGQVATTVPIELKANEVRNIPVIAIAQKEGVHTTLVQLTDLQGNTYTSRNNCTYGHRSFPVPLKTKSDEVKTLDSTLSSSEEVLIQDDQAAPMPQDLGITELPGVATDIAVPEELPEPTLQTQGETVQKTDTKTGQNVEPNELEVPPASQQTAMSSTTTPSQKQETERSKKNDQSLIMSDFLR